MEFPLCRNYSKACECGFSMAVGGGRSDGTTNRTRECFHWE